MARAPEAGALAPPLHTTSSSWLNLVEGWFNLLTERRLRHGTFSSVDELVNGIETWTEHWNHDPKPFAWTKTVKDIIAKVKNAAEPP